MIISNNYTYVMNNPLKYTDPSGYVREKKPETYRDYMESIYGEGGFWYRGNPPGTWGGPGVSGGQTGGNSYWGGSLITRLTGRMNPGPSYSDYMQAKWDAALSDPGTVHLGGGIDAEGLLGVFLRTGKIPVVYVTDAFMVDAVAEGGQFNWNLAKSVGDPLKPLHGWSIDITLAVIPGINIEFGEVYDPNSNQVVKFFTYGFAAGVEASASFNKVTIYPGKGFELSDLGGVSTGWTVGYGFNYSRTRNSKQPYWTMSKYDTYLMVKFGSGPGFGGSFMPRNRTKTYQWDWYKMFR